jgi:double-stranded uracil-DNA glycosylase
MVPAQGVFLEAQLKGLASLIFFGDTAIVLGPLSGSNLPLGADGGPVQSDTLHDMTRPTLPGLLRLGLRLLVCGTAAGRASAVRYAERGNRFWHVLHEVGLTATVSQPGDYAPLLEARIGLIDLAEYVAGEDAALPSNALYAAGLRDVAEAIKPRALAFNGKTTASMFYHGGTHRLSYGRQSERIGETAVYVLPSTAATSAFWSIEPWRELARALR